MTINQNDSVTWTNTDTKEHQVVANGGSFASAILAKGKTHTHAFRGGGTFRYHDGLHPTLKGTVIVRGASPVVSLAVSAPVVKFGTQVTLAGVVNSKRAGETVTIAALPFGQTTKQVVATLQTTSGGAFTFNVTPRSTRRTRRSGRGRKARSASKFSRRSSCRSSRNSGWFHFYVTAGAVVRRPLHLPAALHAREHVDQRRALQLGQRSGRIMGLKFARSRRFRAGAGRPGLHAGKRDAAAVTSMRWSGTQPVVKR